MDTIFIISLIIEAILAFLIVMILILKKIIIKKDHKGVETAIIAILAHYGLKWMILGWLVITAVTCVVFKHIDLHLMVSGVAAALALAVFVIIILFARRT